MLGKFQIKKQDSLGTDMDSLVVAHEKLIKESKITISGKKYVLDAFYRQDNNLYLQFLVVFTNANSQKTLQASVRPKVFLQLRLNLRSN